ncbi:MAG TPA: ADP-ribosylglycohydrolase family protein, partial [Deltaproteobacteria bacterium]|nr:ADP-ribosylglycohydrolase family protein [Deltaproteobacteria bacterium]
GSPSNDLSGACRIAPLVCALRRDEGRLVQAARTQTALTHTDPLTVDAAEFFARWALGVLSGMQPVDAMAEVVQAQFAGTGLEQAVQKGLSLRGQGVVQAVKALGQDCHSPHALPSVVQIVAAHEDDLEEALVDNVMAGGDSAARGMLVGMILGASCGMEAIPGDWIEGMRRARDIDEMLSRLG